MSSTAEDVPFIKLHGIGNDFVVIHAARAARGFDWTTVTPRICDRHFGVGSDGLFIVHDATSHPSEERVIPVTMLNPDGSPMGMCGNGVRCVVRFLVLEGAIPESGTVALDIENRIIRCGYTRGGTVVEASLGIPELAPARIPLRAELDSTGRFPLECAGERFLARAVSVGNPHCVIETDGDVDEMARRFGPELERHSAFPAKANISFMRLVSKDRIRVGVWERAAGITLACGSAACASAVTAYLGGLTARALTVDLPGGSLSLRWDEASGEIFLSGPAIEVFSGVLPGFMFEASVS